MGLFSILNTGVSGLTASRAAVSTTSHNISNVNSDYYTRQRVNTSSMYNHVGSLTLGMGVRVDNVVRIHDEFIYERYRSSTTNKEYSGNKQQNLHEIAQYFPDLQDVGLKNDLANYFSAWNKFSSNPSESAQKINVIQTADTLASHIVETRQKMRDLQNSFDEQIQVAVDNINQMGKAIVEINKEINKLESSNISTANDLRDKREELELGISKLLKVTVYKGDLQGDAKVNTQYSESGSRYTMRIAGAPFVDGANFRPIVLDNSHNKFPYNSIYTVREDGFKTDLTQTITGGKIGSLLDLRGRTFSEGVKDGNYPQDGILQGYIDRLDTLAKSMIVQINNIYAKSAKTQMTSDDNKYLKADTTLAGYDKNINTGSFDVVVYNAQGKEVAKKTIEITKATSMNDTRLGNSIVKDFNANTDDNNDNDSTNDVNDYFRANYQYDEDYRSGVFTITPTKNIGEGYTVAIKDNGTNFPGVIGLSQFFKGTNAATMKVNSELTEDASKLNGFGAPVSGNNDVANEIVQLQYKKIDFHNADLTTDTETLEAYYRFLTSEIANDGEQADTLNDTNTSLHQTINKEFQSVSGVSLDEELANLMKFQTGYSSNAKVITTIDEMLNTLLGLKQ